MRRKSWLTTSGLIVAAAVAAPMIGAQEQSSRARAAWPCGGRVDPAFSQLAEATGGQVHLFSPADFTESTAEMLTALDSHRQTIFRLAGELDPGVHEFRVPIEAAVESVVFSISVQCFRVADIARPSGAPLVGGDGVTDLSNPTQRVVIVKRPEAGVWTIRAAGTGLAGVMVQARSDLGIAEVQFAAVDSALFTRAPLPGVENVVRIYLTGEVSEAQAFLVNAAFRRIASLPLSFVASEGYFSSRATVPTEAFRVMVEGKDATGVAFQRVHAPLLGKP